MRPSLPRARLLSLLAVATLSACSVPTLVAENVHPYRIDVRQGNYVDQAMVSQLKKGMSQEQVRFVLGTPLLSDIFHADRWDYVYRFKRGSGKLEDRRMSVFFVEGKLDHVAGDVVAGEPPEAAMAPPARVIDLGGSAGSAPPAEKKTSSWWSGWWPW
jgi:outer membrane protein assembly factor BamE